jgi:hypothetical protein
VRLAPFACSACGSRYWPDPDSSCELCQPSDYAPEDRRRYCEVEAWEEWNDTETMMREEETQTESENQ